MPRGRGYRKGSKVRAPKTDAPNFKGQSSPVDRGKTNKAPKMSADPSDAPKRKAPSKASQALKKAGKAVAKGASRLSGIGTVAAVGSAAILASKGDGSKKNTTGQRKARRTSQPSTSKANAPKSSPSKTSSAKKAVASAAKQVKKKAEPKSVAKPAASKSSAPKKTGKTLSAFETAFATARQGGRKEFSFGGKRFTTKLKK